MSRVKYTEEQKTEMLELAQEVGIGRAVRELGYGTYVTVMRWARQRGVDVDVDPVKAKAAATAQWYRDDEKRVVAQAGLERVYEQLQEDRLTPQEIHQLSQATKKYVEVLALVDGTPTEIRGEHMADDVFSKMLEEFNNKNVEKHAVSQRDLSVEEER